MLVGYLLALMVFTTSVLLIPGEKYDTLTTSDSGWFYDVAAEIDKTNALAENNPFSHSPYGLSVGLTEQAQPLITVMLYRGVNAINSSVTLMETVKYWAPLLFALSLIPIFLIGKELGGDVGGYAAAFFGATLVSSIYWMKVGAYDREPIQLILGAWTIYLTIKLFKAPRSEMPKFALLAGLVYGIFGLAWSGALYIAPIIIGFLILVLLSERLTWLPVILAGGFLLFTGFMGGIFKGGGTPGGIINLIYILVGTLVFATVIEIFLRKTSAISLFKGILTSIRTNIPLIVGLLGMLAVMTLALWIIGWQNPMFWVGFTQSLLGYAGIGGGGISFTRYAGEMGAPNGWGDTIYGLYGGDPASAWTLPGNTAILTVIVFILVVLALVWLCWYRKREGVLFLSWLIVLALLVWPGQGQARFERMWWPFIAVLAGVGVAVLVSLVRRVSFEQFGEWFKHFQVPIVVALCTSIVVTPFVFNAYAVAEQTTPPTEWHGISGLDEGFKEAFDWIKENISDNSVVSIQWSFGHLLTGASGRASVTDGAEVRGEESKWENDPLFVPRPPDYIYYVIGTSGIIYGVNVPAILYQVNGRRVDVQRFPTMDENEFRWIIRTYRENYNIRIDYVVFSYDEYYYAQQSYQQRYQDEITNALWGAENKAFASTWWSENNNIIFDFGENRENVVFDMNALNAYLKVDENIRYFDGYTVFVVDERGDLVESYGFQPYLYPDIQETLAIHINENGNVMRARLISSATELIGSIEVSPPMGLRVFQGNLENIDYLKVVFTSSNNLVKISKVIYENMP